MVILLWKEMNFRHIFIHLLKAEYPEKTTHHLLLQVNHIQHYVIKFVNDLQQVGGFLWVFRFPPPIKLTTTYNWNIVESGVKHNKSFIYLLF